MWVADAASLLDGIDGPELVRRARLFDLHDLTSEALDIVAGAVGTPSIESAASRFTVGRRRSRERVLAYTETGTILGRTVPRLSELARAAAVHGVEARHPLKGGRTLLRRRVEPSLCAHPALSAGLALIGRPRRIEVAALRALGPLARPPAPCTMRSDEWVELTTAAALDRVAGAGWSWVRQLGTTSLLVYWVHIELVYGKASWWLKDSLGIGETVVAAAVIIPMMLVVSTTSQGICALICVGETK